MLVVVNFPLECCLVDHGGSLSPSKYLCRSLFPSLPGFFSSCCGCVLQPTLRTTGMVQETRSGQDTVVTFLLTLLRTSSFWPMGQGSLWSTMQNSTGKSLPPSPSSTSGFYPVTVSQSSCSNILLAQGFSVGNICTFWGCGNLVGRSVSVTTQRIK